MPGFRAAAAFALASALVLSGCGESQGPGTARFSVKLTDAPGPFKTAKVTISEVYPDRELHSAPISGDRRLRRAPGW